MKKDYPILVILIILIIFGTNIPDTTGREMNVSEIMYVCEM